MNAHTPGPTTTANAPFGRREQSPGLENDPLAARRSPAEVRFGPPSWRLAIVAAVVFVIACMAAAVVVKRHTQNPLFAPASAPVAIADAQVAAAKAKAAAAAARRSAAAAETARTAPAKP